MINDKTNAPVAVPDERAASIRYDVLHEFATKHRVDYNELCTTARAALAATPAAAPVVPKWIDDPHDIEQGQMLNPEWVKVQEVASAPAVDALDAKDRECIAIGRAIQRAAGELPVDGEIRIDIENGAGAVYVLEPKHGDWCYIDSGDVLSAQINEAIDAAIAAAQAKEGGAQ